MDDALLARRLHFLGRRLSQAQRQFDLLADGDRVAIALSGGKDSTALTLALAAWRRGAPLDFSLAAIHVEVEGADGNARRKLQLQLIADRAGIPLDVVTAAPDLGRPPSGRTTHPCFRCAWRRREALFRWAADYGYNKVALGHHLDDAAETALMNLLYRGRLEALAPARVFFDGAVTLIRPLILAEEKELARVAACLETPPSVCACAAANGAVPDSARAHMKAFLRSLARESSRAKRHLWRAAQSVDRSREV